MSRSIVSLRRVFDSEKKQLSFLHEGDQMIVRHDITVNGPMHEVEMALPVSVRYDPAGKMEAIMVEPDDLALFDHVLNSALRELGGLVERRARSSTRSVSCRGRTARMPMG